MNYKERNKMPSFPWEQKYSVGNDEIDNQHKGMFELCSNLYEMNSYEKAAPILARLFEYTREHFTLEEELMQSMGFPKYEEHRLLHEDLLTRLKAIDLDALATEEAIISFKRFIYDWLIDHIMEDDMLYCEFTKNGDGN